VLRVYILILIKLELEKMYTANRFLPKLCFSLAFAILFVVLFISPNKVNAEGSVDFIGYPGYRLFYFAERPQQLKVYASAGEYINFGASHVGIASGFIKIYRPDGTLHSTYNNTGTSEGLAIINDNIEELNGPTGGGTSQGSGYTPGVVLVDNDEGGVWTVTLGYGFYQNSGFDNLLNNEPWTRDQDQPTNRRVVLSWDITVSLNQASNDGGQMQTGRVYTNEYQSIVSENGNTTSPTYYILTDKGFQFQVDYQDVDPWGFQILSNNRGIITGESESTYSSFEQDEVERSADIGTFDPANFYLYEPQAKDSNGLVNNKVFFNLPDPNLPMSARVTDIVRNDTHTTWLLNEVPQYNIEILNVELTSRDPGNVQGIQAVLDRTNGAIITYNTNIDGNVQLVIDINNNGIYGDDKDRIVNAPANIGINEVFWDGLDKNGQALDQQFNRELSYQLRINAGELHLTLSDIENDLGGVRLTRLNGESPNDQFLYDHSRLGEAVSGGNAIPLPTSEPFIFGNNFGDLKILDYWTYESSVTTISDLVLDIVDHIAFLAPDSDGDGIRDDSDLDDDNDGILDVLEICANQAVNCFSTDFNPDYDNDFDGIPNYADADDPAFDLGCTDANGDGRCDNLLFEFDQDQDNIPNSIDLDADNDGIFDVAETLLADVDDDGFLYEGTPIVDEFGRVILSNSSTANYISFTANNDSDELPNFLDLDSDNDSIHDVIEAGHEDPEGDGTLTLNSSEDVNTFGVVIAIPGQVVSSFTKNKDGDNLPDYLDLDADNDGINDVTESGNLDADNDGVADGQVNKFGQLTLNGEIISTSFPKDHDGDGIPNYNDLDSDNDGINDVLEGGNDDPDNDGLVGTGIPLVGSDGRVVLSDGTIVSTSFPLDTDQDGIFDYEDIDSDNDGIFDVYEANLSDPDNDGQIGEGNVEVDENGIVIIAGETNNTSNPIDTDGDGVPDFRDLDSDNDSLSDAEECPTGAPCPDLDNSGEPDYVQFTPVACPVPLVQPTVDAPNSICDNELLTLTVNESDIYESAYPEESITYTWTNNDGLVIATTTNPEFEIIGNDPNLVLPLSVKVSVDVDCESDDSDPVSPEIKSTPNPNPTSSFDRICRGDQVQLFAETISGASYQWFFNGFQFSVNQNPIIQSLNQSTEFDVVATVDGCQNEMQGVFVIAEEPPVIEALLGDGTYCSGTDVVFTAVNNNPNLTGNLNYVLSGPNGLMVDVEVPVNGTFEYTLSAVDFVNDGDYSLIVDNGSNCVSNVESYTVAVTQGPDQPIIAADDDSVCPGDAISLSTQMYTGSNVSYTWTLEGVVVATTTMPELEVNNASSSNVGNYAVQVDTGDGCGVSTSAPVSVSVVDISASPEIENNLTGNSACEGQTVTLRISDPQPETIYTWFDPSGTMVLTGVSELDISNVQMSDAGIYTVEANISGCVTLTDNETIEVSEGLDAPIFDNNMLTACEGQNIEFSVNNFTAEVNTTFNWFSEDGTLLAQTVDPIFEFNNVTTSTSGNYYVVVDQGECSSVESINANLTVTTAPNEMANAGNDVSYCASEIINLNAMMPSVGTGSWISATAIVSDMNNPFTEVTNLTIGENMFIWVLDANGCEDYSRDTVLINVTDVPNEIASIQNMQTSFCESDANNILLSADAISEGVGEWTVTSGPSTLTFSDPNDELTNVTGFNTGTYTLAWTLSTADCGTFSNDEVVLTIDEQPTDVANAGIDQSFCDGVSVSTTANTPSIGLGQWSSNTGVTFSNINDPNAAISGLTQGDNILTWTLSNGACQDYSTDQVVVEITTAPNEQAAVIQNTISICEGTSLAIEAIAPMASQGAWVQNSGPSASIADPNQSITDINYSVAGTYVFAWELSDANCGVYSMAEVNVVVDQLPNESANAGLDNNVCATEVALSAIMPQVGEGVWVSTSGTIIDPSDPNTMVTDLDEGSHTFTWQLSSGSCENYSSDQVTITTSTAPSEVAQVVNNAINICESNLNGTLNLVAIDPMMSSGQWSQVSGPNNAVIANDTEAIASISDLMPGVYQFSWTLSMGNCLDFSDDIMTVTVDEEPTDVFANAGVDQALCATTFIDLNADMPSIGTGSWSIFNTVGASVSDIMNPNTQAQIVEGENVFVWSLSNGGCENYHTDTVSVFLTTPNDQAEIITEAIEACEADVSAVLLEANNINTATGIWTQTAGPNTADIDNVSSEQVNVDNLIPGTYTFQWTLSEGNCTDYASDFISVNISGIPDEDATVAQDEIVVCSANTVFLDAVNPSIGSGSWTVNTTADIVDANLPDTEVSSLESGMNTFTWSLSNDNCVDYSQAEVNVFVEEGVSPVADTYTTSFGTAIQNESLISNDILNNNTDFTVTIIGNAPEVTLNADGTFSFVPDAGFSGEYTFEYDLCDVSCGVCERAQVSIFVEEGASTECDIPNVLTPNNDNKNDALIIDCSNQFDNNIIQIFNRWGDKVYEEETYQNSWRGTFEGDDLPAGTYFYVFKKDKNGSESMTGFITIIR